MQKVSDHVIRGIKFFFYEESVDITMPDGTVYPSLANDVILSIFGAYNFTSDEFDRLQNLRHDKSYTCTNNRGRYTDSILYGDHGPERVRIRSYDNGHVRFEVDPDEYYDFDGVEVIVNDKDVFIECVEAEIEKILKVCKE